MELDVASWELTSTLAPVGMLVLGLLLWLLGRALAKSACVVGGLILGGLGGWLLGQWWAHEGAMVLPLVVGGGIAGAILSMWMFRLWMGLTGALILGLVGPALLFAWQSAPIHTPSEPAHTTDHATPAHESTRSPDDPEDLDDTADLAHSMMKHLGTLLGEASQDSNTSPDDEHPQDPADMSNQAQPASEMLKTQMRAIAGDLYESRKNQFQQWWEQLHLGWWLGVLALAAAGACVGLVIGLGWPYAMASFESALIGAALMLLGVQTWASQGSEEASGLAGLPQSPLAWGVALGLITAGGVVIQWILFARKADK